MTTTILPPAFPASMTRCAERIWLKKKTRDGVASSSPSATCLAMLRRGTSETGKPGEPAAYRAVFLAFDADAVPASSGMRLRNMNELVGNPCRRTTVGEWESPASR